MRKLGLAHNFWQEKEQVNYAEVLAYPQLLAKRIASELSHNLGLPTTFGKRNTT